MSEAKLAAPSVRRIVFVCPRCLGHDQEGLWCHHCGGVGTVPHKPRRRNSPNVQGEQS